ncbi:hypothetical protein K456DRAFT_403890 [Colletotrichum gloeosporioides 23]|nr:hypothetical protein K456DRAFT_403890 [Colletotrichum gloeosporioides 23]
MVVSAIIVAAIIVLANIVLDVLSHCRFFGHCHHIGHCRLGQCGCPLSLSSVVVLCRHPLPSSLLSSP